MYVYPFSPVSTAENEATDELILNCISTGYPGLLLMPGESHLHKSKLAPKMHAKHAFPDTYIEMH